MPTFLYSPQVRAHISTRNNGIVDISDDLVQGNLTIRTNGIHTFNFQLQNAQRKYDRVIQPMDRITVEMFRVGWVRVFSGYLNNGPIFSAWPRVLTLAASCTLKRLQFWYWDPDASASAALIDSTLGTGRQTPAAVAGTTGAAQQAADGGGPTGNQGFDAAVSQTVVNILSQVVKWPEDKIHIAAIPGDWASTATAFGESALAAADMTPMFGDFSMTTGLDAVIGTGPPPGTAPTGVGGVVGGAPLTPGSGSLPAGNYGGTNLSAEQASNAALIASIGANRGLSGNAQQIAIATAMQESTLRNLTYGDRDSQGLFQQRPSAGWGTVAQITNPTYAANKFYDALVKVPGWESMTLTRAAQAVQRSAFPNAYAKWQAVAAALLAASTGAPVNPVAGGPTDPSGATAGATAAAAGAAEPIARAVDNSLINIYQWGLTPSNLYGDLLSGPRAMMNDQPLLPYIANLMASCMRSWCSAPNGDFISWFPDYFGIWNSAAKMNIEPIELMDFTVEWNDQEIVTHQYVVGTPMAMISGATAEVQGSVDASGMNWVLSTSGIATMDMPGIFALVFGSDPGAQFATDYLNRFGGRPNLQNMPLIHQGTPEFIMAIYLFMQRWANQFKANVPMTFMPELWPGMLLCIPAYSFQAYVLEVQHSFQFGKGGGFYTTAKICAPARTTDSDPASVFGLLPLAGSARAAGSATTSGNTGTGVPSADDANPLPDGVGGTGGNIGNTSGVGIPGSPFG